MLLQAETACVVVDVGSLSLFHPDIRSSDSVGRDSDKSVENPEILSNLYDHERFKIASSTKLKIQR